MGMNQDKQKPNQKEVNIPPYAIGIIIAVVGLFFLPEWLMYVLTFIAVVIGTVWGWHKFKQWRLQRSGVHICPEIKKVEVLCGKCGHLYDEKTGKITDDMTGGKK